MKLNVSYPPTGAQKCLEIDDEAKLRAFYDKRMSQEVDGNVLGDEFKGYIFKINGGNDKQGFPMKQGVLTNTRVRLLMSKGATCYRPRRDGERKRKSIRGCIVGPDISVLHLVVVKKGEEEVPGLTDKYIPRRLGPKRASKIRKLFNLTKADDVRKYVIRREIAPKEGKEQKKKVTKAPKIQRLVTPAVIQRRKTVIRLRRRRAQRREAEAEEYAELLAQRSKEAKERRQSTISARRQSGKEAEAPKKTEAPKKAEGKKTEAPKKAEGKKAEGKKTEAPKKAEAKKTEAPKKAEGKKTEAPKKAAEAPKKATEAPKKAAEAPKKAAEAPKKTTEAAAKKTEGAKKGKK